MTYTYGRVYKEGDELKIHSDRPDEISLTLHLSGDWLIYIEKPNGNYASAVLYPGDDYIWVVFMVYW